MSPPRQAPRPADRPDRRVPGFSQGLVPRFSRAQWANDPLPPHGHAPGDPAGLIVTLFEPRRRADEDAATLVLAWLSTLAPADDPPAAARSLLARIAVKDNFCLSAQQRQILDLLSFIGRHHRAAAFAKSPKTAASPRRCNP